MINDTDEFGNKRRLSLLEKLCTDETFLDNLQTM